MLGALSSQIQIRQRPPTTDLCKPTAPAGSQISVAGDAVWCPHGLVKEVARQASSPQFKKARKSRPWSHILYSQVFLARDIQLDPPSDYFAAYQGQVGSESGSAAATLKGHADHRQRTPCANLPWRRTSLLAEILPVRSSSFFIPVFYLHASKTPTRLAAVFTTLSAIPPTWSPQILHKTAAHFSPPFVQRSPPNLVRTSPQHPDSASHAQNSHHTHSLHPTPSQTRHASPTMAVGPSQTHRRALQD